MGVVNVAGWMTHVAYPCYCRIDVWKNMWMKWMRAILGMCCVVGVFVVMDDK